jgi:hypothetical protein
MRNYQDRLAKVPNGAWVVYTDGGYDPPEEKEPEKCGWGTSFRRRYTQQASSRPSNR